MRRLTLIFFECKDMMLKNVWGNQNIVLGRQENFLWWFEDEFHSLNFSEPDFVVAMRSEKPPWESAKQLQVASLSHCIKFYWRPRTMFWVFKTFSIIIQLRSKKN